MKCFVFLMFVVCFIGNTIWSAEPVMPSPVNSEVTLVTPTPEIPVVNPTPVDMMDARNIARAVLSFEETVAYSGNFSYDRELLNGVSQSVQGSFEGKFFLENGRRVFRFTALSVTYGESGRPVSYYGDPLAVFPYPQQGVPANFWVHIMGWDANSQPTRWGNYSTPVWRKGDPLVFQMKPWFLPVLIPFDLGDRPAESVSLILDRWGSLSYNEHQGGFLVWIDPSQTYTGRIIDRFNQDAVIFELPRLSYGNLPSTEPTGSAPNLRWASGVESVKFENDFYSPQDPKSFNNYVVEGDQTVPASVFIVETDELNGFGLSGHILDFAGRIQVEAFDSPGHGVIILDRIWEDPSQFCQFEVPPGYVSVMITLIKSNGRVVMPEDWVWDPNKFSLMIARTWGGKG